MLGDGGRQFSALHLPGDFVDLHSFPTKGAILSFDNLGADPRKLAAGLLTRAAERGARFYAPAEATAFSRDADQVFVSTKEGPHIEAKYVILATGYELVSVVPTTRHRVVSTDAIATPPLPGRLPSDLPLIWEASDPYLYLRRTRDNRVICGGEDEPFVDEARRGRYASREGGTDSRQGQSLASIRLTGGCIRLDRRIRHYRNRTSVHRIDPQASEALRCHGLRRQRYNILADRCRVDPLGIDRGKGPRQHFALKSNH